METTLVRMIAGMATFFEFADEHVVDRKIALNMLEDLAVMLGDLSDGDAKRFADLMEIVANEADSPTEAEFLRRLAGVRR